MLIFLTSFLRQLGALSWPSPSQQVGRSLLLHLFKRKVFFQQCGGISWRDNGLLAHIIWWVDCHRTRLFPLKAGARRSLDPSRRRVGNIIAGMERAVRCKNRRPFFPAKGEDSPWPFPTVGRLCPDRRAPSARYKKSGQDSSFRGRRRGLSTFCRRICSILGGSSLAPSKYANSSHLLI